MQEYLPALPLRRRGVAMAALSLLVGAALLADVAKFIELWELSPANTGEMAQRDQRFEPLRSALPRRGTVGYVSDVKDRADLEMRLMLAQFSLAPVILVSGGEQPLTVGDFWGPAWSREARDRNLTVRRDFGNGVVLFAHAVR